jgi:hypothetical protein
VLAISPGRSAVAVAQIPALRDNASFSVLHYESAGIVSNAAA